MTRHQVVAVEAQVWIDETRIDRAAVATTPAASGQLSSYDGLIEISVPIDIGPLGQVATMRFPASALIRAYQVPPGPAT